MRRLSTDKYVRQRQIELAVDLERKKAVYLDVKFWIILRDVAAGRRAGSDEIQLLHSLRECVSKGKVFCPVSDSIFAELLKQSDPITRNETARLIDELSLGVAIIPFESRVGTELAHFIYATGSRPNDLHPLKHLVWSKQSYVLGYVHPTLPGFDDETQDVLQKEFFNHMWAISMSEMINRIGDATPPDFFASSGKLANDLNVQNAKHASEIRSFEQAYFVEIQGAIDVFAGTAVDIIREMSEKRSGYQVELSTTERLVHEREVKNLLFAAFNRAGPRTPCEHCISWHAYMHLFDGTNRNNSRKTTSLIFGMPLRPSGIAMHFSQSVQCER